MYGNNSQNNLCVNNLLVVERSISFLSQDLARKLYTCMGTFDGQTVVERGGPLTLECENCIKNTEG